MKILQLFIFLLNFMIFRPYVFGQQNEMIFYNNKSNHFALKGKIIDRESKADLSYVNIKLKNKPFGALSGVDGSFFLHIDSLSVKDTIQFSLLGYETYEVQVDQVLDGEEKVITLRNIGIVLPNLIIGGEESTAISLMTKVIEEIPNNYENQNMTLKMNIQRRFEDSNYEGPIVSKILSEVYYDKGYDNINPGNPVWNVNSGCYYSFNKSRNEWQVIEKFINQAKKDMWGIGLRDMIKYREGNIFNVKNLKHYEFDIEYEDDNYIILRFVSNKNKFGVVPFDNLLSYRGKLYLNKKNYSVYKIESSMVLDPKKLKVKIENNHNSPLSIELITLYQQNNNNKYYWYKSFYKDNHWLNSEVINENYQVIIGENQKISNNLRFDEKYICD